MSPSPKRYVIGGSTPRREVPRNSDYRVIVAAPELWRPRTNGSEQQSPEGTVPVPSPDESGASDYGEAGSQDGITTVSEDQDGLPLSVNRVIKNKFPKSQHCPVIVSVRIIIPTIDKPPMPRWNLRKADWFAFSKYVEENINRIKPETDNYIRFVKLLKTAA